MSVEFQWAVAIGLFVLDVAAIVIAFEMGKLRRGLPTAGAKEVCKDFSLSHSHQHLFHHGVTGSHAGYAIYVFREGRWVIEADLSAPGYEPSPPTLPGSFEGHVLKKESTPSPGH